MLYYFYSVFFLFLLWLNHWKMVLFIWVTNLTSSVPWLIRYSRSLYIEVIMQLWDKLISQIGHRSSMEIHSLLHFSSVCKVVLDMFYHIWCKEKGSCVENSFERRRQPFWFFTFSSINLLIYNVFWYSQFLLQSKGGVSDCCLTPSSAIFQLYHGENKGVFYCSLLYISRISLMKRLKKLIWTSSGDTLKKKQ